MRNVPYGLCIWTHGPLPGGCVWKGCGAPKKVELCWQKHAIGGEDLRFYSMVPLPSLFLLPVVVKMSPFSFPVLAACCHVFPFFLDSPFITLFHLFKVTFSHFFNHNNRKATNTHMIWKAHLRSNNHIQVYSHHVHCIIGPMARMWQSEQN